ncbi:MAG: DUF2130 domain-containing protein [Steroidobacterales bacterium]
MADKSQPLTAQLLLSPDTTVRCPSCEREFSLEQGFAKKALEHLEQHSRSALEAAQAKVKNEVERQGAALATERQGAAQREIAQLRQLLKQQSDTHAGALAEMRSLTEQALAPQLQALRAELAQSQAQLGTLAEREAALAARERGIDGQVAEAAGLRAQELLATERQAFEQRIADQDAQLAVLRVQQLELLRSKSALEDRAGQLELEVARRLDVGRADLETRIRAQEKERADLEKAELQKKLEDVNAKLVEAQQKGSQGSQQLQGEVLELMIEDQLRQAFPADAFEEVKKGARGADVVQRVMTRAQQLAGTILWEAKRAKEWGREWPAKLKDDMRAAGADVGILVTTSLPREMPAAQMFGLHEDVWVTSWSAAVPLACALRERVLEVHKHRAISAGKGEKMEALYDYLTSAQFAQKLKAIYGAFQAMQEDLQKERTAAEQRWARREKQIGTGMKEIAGFAGDVQGLAQQSLPQLELQPDLPLER